eukprot:TRINITY_DN4773_c0_g2_i4.p1 TRINITY_DN4773_c0_g2~~TRINITY_DN4773_c0_g2_i4.p1  ORF type:complete len:143 (-),score=30.83 TRINITY_DN4773_c0_g2_i4:30-458(-)
MLIGATVFYYVKNRSFVREPVKVAPKGDDAKMHVIDLDGHTNDHKSLNHYSVLDTKSLVWQTNRQLPFSAPSDEHRINSPDVRSRISFEIPSPELSPPSQVIEEKQSLPDQNSPRERKSLLQQPAPEGLEVNRSMKIEDLEQ